MNQSKQKIKVALIGNPNVGKSSVFNRLTGLNQKVGNYPGVTVEIKTHTFKLNDRIEVEITDLPGTYSLHPKSIDERIVTEVLLNPDDKRFPDLVFFIADASKLKRNLLLFTQIADLGFPIIVGLNQMDQAILNNTAPDIERLKKNIPFPLIEINGRTGAGLVNFKIALEAALTSKSPNLYFNPDANTRRLLPRIKGLSATDNTYADLLVFHHGTKLDFVSKASKSEIEQINQKMGSQSVSMQIAETIARYQCIAAIIEDDIVIPKAIKPTITEKIDALLTHRIWGTGIFLFFILLLFQSVFTWSSVPMDLIDQGFAQLGRLLGEMLPQGVATDLLVNAIVPGIAGVLIFVPQIAILFFLLSLLDEVGYLSRVVFLLDRIMRKFGLNGKSYVSLISGVACAIPAVMAARTIGNHKERLITIFITPFISCSARLPVFVLLIGFLIPQQYYFGFIHSQGLFMVLLYVSGFVVALVTAIILKRFVKIDESGYHVMELPDYRPPQWANVGISVYQQTSAFITEAGKIILAISIVLWALASYGPPKQMDLAIKQAQITAQQHNLSQTETDALIAQRKIETSFAGMLGRTIEPAIKPLGYDWKIGIALITSFAAREVFVGALATLYSVADTENTHSMIDKLKAQTDPKTKLPTFSIPVTASLLVFFLFAMQCMSTLAIVKKETGSYIWPLAQLIYMSGLAYFLAWATYATLSVFA